jgi:hypothetical protein
LKLIPKVSTLIVAESEVRLEPEGVEELWLSNLLPKDTLKKLDLGFSVFPCLEREFLNLMQTGVLDEIEFLGLAGSRVSEISMAKILTLDHLQSLDLVGCQFLQSQSAQVFCSQPQVRTCFKEVWLPDGAYFPVFGNEEQLHYTIDHGGAALEGRGGRLCTMKSETQQITVRPTNQNTFRRRMHIENAATITPGCWSTFFAQNRLPAFCKYGSWTRREPMSKASYEQVSGYVAPPVMNRGGSKAGSMMMPIAFGGETFNINATKNMTGKVTVLAITRTSTGERRTLSSPPGPGGFKKHRISNFPGVSPLLYLCAFQSLSLKEAVAVDHLAI